MLHSKVTYTLVSYALQTSPLNYSMVAKKIEREGNNKMMMIPQLTIFLAWYSPSEYITLSPSAQLQCLHN